MLVVGILATIGLVRYSSIIERSRSAEAINMLRAIAESIENPQVFETLANLGVHYCQGDFQDRACILDELILSDIGTDLASAKKAGRSEKGAG